VIITIIVLCILCEFLRFQAIIAACSEEPSKKAKSPVHTSETLQKPIMSTTVSGDKPSDGIYQRDMSPHQHTQQSDLIAAAELLSLKLGAKDREQSAAGQERSSTLQSPKPVILPGDIDDERAKHPVDAGTQSSQLESRTHVCESYVEMLGPPPPPPLISNSRSPSKHQSKSNQSRRRATPEGSTSSPPNWQKTTGDSSRADVVVCQRQVVDSQAVGFPTATRLTATVAPSPVRFNMPVIVPQVSATNYYNSRQVQHGYYPYQGQNVFTYPVGGYMPSMKPYQPSTLASWSNMQEMSQYSYQPVLAASLCPPNVGRGVQQHTQPSHILRAGLSGQPQYHNLQPAHTSLALYPAAFGVIAPSAAVLPPSHIIDASSPVRVYEPRSFAAGEKTSVNVQSSLAVQSATSVVRPTSVVAHRSKQQQPGTYIAASIQPAHSVTTHATCDTAIGTTIAATERSDANKLTPMTAAAAIIQPFGFYASCPPTSLGITNFASGQIQSFPVGKCFPLHCFNIVILRDGYLTKTSQ